MFLSVTRGRSGLLYRAADCFHQRESTPSPVAIATAMGGAAQSGSEKSVLLFLLVDVGRRCEVWLSAGCGGAGRPLGGADQQGWD